jgi:hypothetical protein
MVAIGERPAAERGLGCCIRRSTASICRCSRALAWHGVLTVRSATRLLQLAM